MSTRLGLYGTTIAGLDEATIAPAGSIGPVAATAGVSTGVGTAWSSVSEVTSDNGVGATTEIGPLSPTTDSAFLRVSWTTGFEGLPDTSAITGLTLRIKVKASVSGQIKLKHTYLTPTNAAAGGSNLPITKTVTTNFQTFTSGSEFELWGQAWTPSIIKNGVYAWLRIEHIDEFGFDATAEIDAVTLEVSYTTPTGPGEHVRSIGEFGEFSSVAAWWTYLRGLGQLDDNTDYIGVVTPGTYNDIDLPQASPTPGTNTRIILRGFFSPLAAGATIFNSVGDQAFEVLCSAPLKLRIENIKFQRTTTGFAGNVVQIAPSGGAAIDLTFDRCMFSGPGPSTSAAQENLLGWTAPTASGSFARLTIANCLFTGSRSRGVFATSTNTIVAVLNTLFYNNRGDGVEISGGAIYSGVVNCIGFLSATGSVYDVGSFATTTSFSNSGAAGSTVITPSEYFTGFRRKEYDGVGSNVIDNQGTTLADEYRTDIVGFVRTPPWSAGMEELEDVGTPPALTVTSPAEGQSYRFGDTIPYNVSASDTEQGNLTPDIEVSIDGGAYMPTDDTGLGFLSPLSLGAHTIAFRVTDGTTTVSTLRNISVTNLTAIATASQTELWSGDPNTLTLDARDSVAAEDPLTFTWTQTAGDSAEIVSPSSGLTVVNLPRVTTETDFTFQVEIDDGSSTDTATVTVTAYYGRQSLLYAVNQAWRGLKDRAVTIPHSETGTLRTSLYGFPMRFDSLGRGEGDGALLDFTDPANRFVSFGQLEASAGGIPPLMFALSECIIGGYRDKALQRFMDDLWETCEDVRTTCGAGGWPKDVGVDSNGVIWGVNQIAGRLEFAETRTDLCNFDAAATTAPPAALARYAKGLYQERDYYGATSYQGPLKTALEWFETVMLGIRDSADYGMATGGVPTVFPYAKATGATWDDNPRSQNGWPAGYGDSYMEKIAINDYAWTNAIYSLLYLWDAVKAIEDAGGSIPATDAATTFTADDIIENIELHVQRMLDIYAENNGMPGFVSAKTIASSNNYINHATTGRGKEGPCKMLGQTGWWQALATYYANVPDGTTANTNTIKADIWASGGNGVLNDYFFTLLQTFDDNPTTLMYNGRDGEFLPTGNERLPLMVVEKTNATLGSLHGGQSENTILYALEGSIGYGFAGYSYESDSCADGNGSKFATSGTDVSRSGPCHDPVVAPNAGAGYHWVAATSSGHGYDLAARLFIDNGAETEVLEPDYSTLANIARQRMLPQHNVFSVNSLWPASTLPGASQFTSQRSDNGLWEASPTLTTKTVFENIWAIAIALQEGDDGGPYGVTIDQTVIDSDGDGLTDGSDTLPFDSDNKGGQPNPSIIQPRRVRVMNNHFPIPQAMNRYLTRITRLRRRKEND